MTTYYMTAFIRKPRKGKTTETECRSVGAWGWQWEQEINLKGTGEIWRMMEMFHMLMC